MSTNNTSLWEEGNRGSMSEYVRRAVFRKMNDTFLSVLRQHHGQRSIAVPPRKPVRDAMHVQVLPTVTAPVVPPLPPQKPVMPLSVGLLDDIDEAELVQIRGILRRESVKRVVEEIAAETGVPAVRIVSTSRNKAVVAARHRAFYELHMAGFSLTQIGRMFHKDHTTALHGIRVHMARNGL